jgi:catechol 2,3-dioxygenase-like lactoylglutathione lyase family enzyme
MLLRMEHANIRVGSVDEKARFLRTAFPEFELRAERSRQDGDATRRWIHLGTGDSYVTLNEVTPEGADGRAPGVGHIGYVVDDVDALHRRLDDAGYHVGEIGEEGAGPYRKRFYATDAEEVEWEFVQYLTDDPAKMNVYE